MSLTIGRRSGTNRSRLEILRHVAARSDINLKNRHVCGKSTDNVRRRYR